MKKRWNEKERVGGVDEEKRWSGKERSNGRRRGGEVEGS